jgi:hypothetical protein
MIEHSLSRKVNTNADGLSRQRVMTELSVRLGLNQLLVS